jgi:RNA polymerase sigma-70 factor (sigma-E family)
VRAARDDEFEAFVRGNRAWLVRFAGTLTAGDAHLAEDLVQAALVRVYLARPSRTRDLRGYVRRAVVNGLIDHERRPFSRRERSAPQLPERAAAASADSVDPELIAALAALPARMRAAVVLRHVEGLSVEETAGALGCSAGNVKSQSSRGLDKLRDLLSPGGPSTATASPGIVRPSPGRHTSATTDPRTCGA